MDKIALLELNTELQEVAKFLPDGVRWSMLDALRKRRVEINEKS